MSRLAYNQFRSWELPADEDGNDEGYLVEYLDGGKSNVATHEGYVSWSPKAQFDNAYRNCDAMTFGLALEALERGGKVARAGWNGKGMWLILVAGQKAVQLREGSPYAVALGADQPTCEILPHIDMWTTNAEGRRAMLPGWLASQTDMLAKDWVLL